MLHFRRVDRHQLVVTALAARLHAYLRKSAIGRVLVSPADVRRADRTRNRVQPDVFVVRLTEGTLPSYPYELSELEVESPSDSAYDYHTKRELYLSSGVPEYWILSPTARTAARWRGEADPGELLTVRLEWQPAGIPESLVLDIPEFFDDALG